jgi:mono/diheme cytochrome c family protein
MHAVPSLVGTGLETRWDDAALSALLLEGRGAMPRFAHLRDEERQAVLAHVRRLVDGGRPPSNEPPQEP